MWQKHLLMNSKESGFVSQIECLEGVKELGVYNPRLRPQYSLRH